ncbi:uncharacterized protein LOC115257083 [Aedes albopictus]|uniref:Secreted protein n=1 Tax=Aedes albopictus TaxID=7160 RepID=A0ABM1Z7Q9_AEDAL
MPENLGDPTSQPRSPTTIQETLYRVQAAAEDHAEQPEVEEGHWSSQPPSVTARCYFLATTHPPKAETKERPIWSLSSGDKSGQLRLGRDEDSGLDSGTTAELHENLIGRRTVESRKSSRLPIRSEGDRWIM